MMSIRVISLLAALLTSLTAFAAPAPDTAAVDTMEEQYGISTPQLEEVIEIFLDAKDALKEGQPALAKVLEAYAGHRISYWVYHNIVTSFPVERLQELQDKGLPVPADMVDPLRVLGIAALVLSRSTLQFHVAHLDYRSAEVRNCAAATQGCLDEVVEFLIAKDEAAQAVECIRESLETFTGLSKVEEGWYIE